MKKSKQPRPDSPGRRRLMGVLTLGGGAVAAKTLPERWTRPVVDSVTLPAHAQTTGPGGAESLRFSCEVLGANTITPLGFGDVMMTITPAPGPGIPIQAMGTCNGNLVINNTQNFDFTTGQATVTVGPLDPACIPGQMLTLVLTATSLGGLTATCVFEVIM